MSRQTQPRFIQYLPSFSEIVGQEPNIRLLCDSEPTGLPLFHEACIYHQPTRSIFVTSNQLQNAASNVYAHTDNKHIKLLRIRDGATAEIEEITFADGEYAMLNGGVNFGSDSILLCAQGSKSVSDLSGIVSLSVLPGERPSIVVNSFHGIPFNSVNDVVVHPEDDSIWFTDPSYGHGQGIRNPPQLPNHVYRYEPRSKSIRAVIDGLVRPNGLCFSPDLQTLYVTDTGAIHGSPDIPTNLSGPSHIYAFDILYFPSHGQSEGPFLANRRLFAYAPGKFPDGIKCDLNGNVYAGCGDGIEVWNKAGTLIGTVAIHGGVSNFCFGEAGVIYACNKTRFWKIQLNPKVAKGALLGIS